MSNPNVTRLQLAASVANGICTAQMPASAGALTLNGSLVTAGVANLTTARRVAVGSTSDSDSALVFTIVGTDRGGNAISDTVTGVTSAVVPYTTLDFLTVTGVTTTGASAGNITVGTNGVGSSPWVIANFLDFISAIAIGCIGPAGTSYSVQHTYDDINQTQTNLPYGFSIEPGSNVPPIAWDNAVIKNVSGTNEVRYIDWPIFAYRLTILSGTGSVMMQSIQAGRGSGHA